MDIRIEKSDGATVESLRNLFLAESPFQFVYNKCHGAGWADVYHFSLDGKSVGYGSLWGKERREDRDTVFEFYLLPPFRKWAPVIFPEFLKVSGAGFINCQTNDPLLSEMTFAFSGNIQAEAILFEEAFTTRLSVPGDVILKPMRAGDFTEYQLEENGIVVATGGFVWNYNFPYIDMYYEVREDRRRQGLGSFMTQQLKSEAYRLNRVPAARCNVANHASKATLLKAGMRVCGHILLGVVSDRT